MKRRGQVFTGDLVLGIIIFMMTLAIAIQLWETSYNDVRSSEESYEMNWFAETASEQLVRTGGEPESWTSHDVVSFGLAQTRGLDRVVESRVLDPDKLLSLVRAFKENYTFARNRLLGSGNYDVYLELSCLNSTSLSCMQGLPLGYFTSDYLGSSVGCLNQVIHIDRYTTSGQPMTDSMYWLEAEDIWGTPTSDGCDKGCSANMSYIHSAEAGPQYTFETKPEMYYIWARLLDRNSVGKLLVDGAKYQLFNRSGSDYEGHMRWVQLGNQTLGSRTAIALNDTDAREEVDALLFTTDIAYNPQDEESNPMQTSSPYGNPIVHAPCIIGRVGGGSDSVSVSKTAVIADQPSSTGLNLGGGNTVMGNVLQIKVVVWGGTEMNPRSWDTSTSTTTTTLWNDLPCDGNPDEHCIANNRPAIEIKNITLWESGVPDSRISCQPGGPKEFTVYWRGRHNGDHNYFGFFIDNGTHLVGTCQSINGAEQLGLLYNYAMNCSITATPIWNVPDGTHDFIVTGEDFSGYCFPRGMNATAYQDDEASVRVTTEGCLSYTSLTCTPVSFSGTRDKCGTNTGEVQSIFALKVNGGYLKCGAGESTEVHTLWAGWHGTDTKVQWTYVVNRTDGGYTTVGKCYSTPLVAESPSGTYYYDLRCDIPAAAVSSLPGSSYQLYVIAEPTNDQYCNNPKSGEAVASTLIQTCTAPPGASSQSSESSQISQASQASQSASGSSGASESSAAGGAGIISITYTVDNSINNGNVRNAEMWTDISGTFANTTVLDPPVDFALGDDTESVSDPDGTCNKYDIKFIYNDNSEVWYHGAPDHANCH